VLSVVALLPGVAQADNPPNGGAAAEQPKPKSEPKADNAGAAQPGQPGTEPVPGSLTPVVPGTKAKLLPDGTAAAPADAPPQVQQAIWAANRLQSKPYRYGGGHAKVEDSGYDCSGTVSYALIAAGLLKTPLDSGSFMRWGEAGRGQWITVYTNPGHAYVIIAGLRLDTSAAYARSARRSSRRKARSTSKRTVLNAKALERGPRWRPGKRPSRGFTARHPLGF
jgi:hypothetical protein